MIAGELTLAVASGADLDRIFGRVKEDEGEDWIFGGEDEDEAQLEATVPAAEAASRTTSLPDDILDLGGEDDSASPSSGSDLTTTAVSSPAAVAEPDSEEEAIKGISS